MTGECSEQILCFSIAFSLIIVLLCFIIWAVCANSFLIEWITKIIIIITIKSSSKFASKKKRGYHLYNLIISRQIEHIVFSRFFLFLFIPGDNQIWKCVKHKSCRVMAIRGNEQMYKYLKDVEGKDAGNGIYRLRNYEKGFFFIFFFSCI